MSTCILCTSDGKERKYFFKGKALCDAHYAAYLEFLIKGMDETVTSSSAHDAFASLQLSLKPKPAPKPESKAVSKSYDNEDEDYSFGMKM